MKLTAVILTFNEESNIGDCVKGLQFCNEIIIVDSGSTDNTVKIAAKLGADVYDHSFKNFSDSRNFGLKKSHGDWVLFVDADERIPDQLKKEIISKVNLNNSTAGYYFKRNDFMFERWLKYGETAKVRLLRMAKRDAGVWERSVHEIWQVKGKTEEMSNAIEHLSHSSIEEFVKKINYYSSFDAKEYYQNGRRARFWHLLAYPVAKFGQNYFWRGGFLDGEAGLVFAVLMSFNSFLIRAKLWLLPRKNAHRY